MIKLKDLRKSKKLTQAEVADYFGINRTTLTKYELGQSEPPNELLLKFADYYGVTVDYILGRKKSADDLSTDSNLSPDEKKLLEIFDSLDQEQQKQLLRLVQYTVSLNSK